MNFHGKPNLLSMMRNPGFALIAAFAVLAPSRCHSQPASSVTSTKHSASSNQSSDNAMRKRQGGVSQEALKRGADDAVIFVRPYSSDGANIGIAYNAKVSHALAKADVSRLLSAGKWQMNGPLQITDESLHPDRPKEFPPTTGVFFRVARAPQVMDNAPNLLPYLKAFQRFQRFDLNFELGTLEPYRGVTRVQNSVVDIQMARDEGLYSFQISVHDHKENMPALVNSGEAIDNTLADNSSASASPEQGQMGSRENIGRKRTPRRPNMLLVVTLALVAGVLVGGSIYVAMSRQSSR